MISKIPSVEECTKQAMDILTPEMAPINSASVRVEEDNSSATGIMSTSMQQSSVYRQPHLVKTTFELTSHDMHRKEDRRRRGSDDASNLCVSDGNSVPQRAGMKRKRQQLTDNYAHGGSVASLSRYKTPVVGGHTQVQTIKCVATTASSTVDAELTDTTKNSVVEDQEKTKSHKRSYMTTTGNEGKLQVTLQLDLIMLILLVLLLRHRLQKKLYPKDEQPQYHDLTSLVKIFEKLESHTQLDPNVIQDTKIGKLLP